MEEFRRAITRPLLPQNTGCLVLLLNFFMPSESSQDMDAPALDDVDRGVLFCLQEDARNTTIEEIAAEVEVSPSTVRNRIEKLEQSGIIEGYIPQINYERAKFPLHVLFVCSAPAEDREELAKKAIDSLGVVSVRELLTSRRNLHVETVATDTKDLTQITNQLTALGFEVVSSEIMTNYYYRPWATFEYESDFISE